MSAERMGISLYSPLAMSDDTDDPESLSDTVVKAQDMSAIESGKLAMSNYRNLLSLDNGFVALLNIVFIGLGIGVILQTSYPAAYAGWFLAVSGILGILDAIRNRVNP